MVCDGVSTSAKITKTNPMAENVNTNDKIEKNGSIVVERKRSCRLAGKTILTRRSAIEKKGRSSEIKKVALAHCLI